jgi:hypothetical protein
LEAGPKIQRRSSFYGAKREEVAGSENSEVCRATFGCNLIGGCRGTGFTGKVRVATNAVATRSAATDFTEITTSTTTPPLTKILDCLIGGGISACGDVV